MFYYYRMKVCMCLGIIPGGGGSVNPLPRVEQSFPDV